MASHPPSVDALARDLEDSGLPHALCVEVARKAIAAGDVDRAREMADALARSLLRPVINATGVLLHTNLGRAPLGSGPVWSYSNLELDLATGGRGDRRNHAASLLARLCGAEDALVVNNGAAAVLLVLAALAHGRAVVVSRGELVEIGGGFRIPEVLAQSGAELVEVGSTNRSRVEDYQGAVASGAPAVVLKVHASNYRITGFTEQVPVADLAPLGVPVVADIGSGLLDATCPWLRGGPPSWIAGEPAAKQTLESGAALVTFSGDKLLGGPQAGVIAGSAELVSRCARHPLARAMRPGGLVLSALQQTADAYLRRDGARIPFWRMATLEVDQLRSRAEALAEGTPTALSSVAGGGTLPGTEIPSFGVAVDGDITSALRRSEPPVIARVEGGRTLLDLRTVDPADDEVVAKAIASATPSH